jgi:glycosyltransferase involved in cell wall biosynthesis
MPKSRVKIKTFWIPAHPAYGSVSMRRYWQALAEQCREGDRYRVHSVIQPSDEGFGSGLAGKVQRYWQRRYGYPRTIRREFKGEIAHVLDHSWADLLCHVPAPARKVVTVHDLIPLRFPGDLSPAQLQRFRSWVGHVGTADAVIADSQYTKDEVIEWLKVPGDKVHVVPCGVELPRVDRAVEPLAAVPRAAGTLRVGSIGSTIARKNLAVLPAALATCAQQTGRPLVLVRVGAPLPPALAAAVRSALGDGGLVELGYLSDADVVRFYASIDAVVIPSLYEGFGLPVIEGMAARIPVVAAAATSLPEVGGDVAYYFDPQSPEELGQVLAKVALDGVPERQLEEGYQRAKRLSWRNCLEGIFEVYDAVKG